MYDKTIKERLKELGKDQGWLAEETGIRRDYLNKIINKKVRRPCLWDALKISLVLSIPAELLWIPKEEDLGNTTSTNDGHGGRETGRVV